MEVVDWLRRNILLCESEGEPQRDGFYRERMMTAIIEFMGIQSARQRLRQLSNEIHAIIDTATRQRIEHWKSFSNDVHQEQQQQQQQENHRKKMKEVSEKMEEYRRQTRQLDCKITKVTQLLTVR